ncbi:MAG: thioredoxin family protein [Tissierellia bacterium]|nr:thioredoxin family protein [Tissierellia bacterium]
MLELDRKNFEAEVLESKGYTFVDFWSEACVPCKTLMPKVHELAEKYGDKIKFCSLDITKARRVAIGQQVLGLPTMLMYKDGEKIDTINAENATVENIEAMIKKYY